ncbi:MAG: ATP/GTP-binding protein [Staphylothermus sp.]|nr:ATP/GTP-binding protein [Staphylothermus sp.]
MPYFIIVLGTAGSGKTTLTASLQDYLLNHNLDVVTVNLDPAVESLPYKPDVDVREYVNARDLMLKTGLGPNGALIAAVDMLATRIDELKDEIWSLKTNYIIIDTPGQMEIFAYREIGPLLLDTIVGDAKAVSLFLIDGIYASKPSNYFSALLLSASTHVRLGFPQINVLTKIDLLPENIIENINEFHNDPYMFATKIVEDRKTSLIWSEDELMVLLEKLLMTDIVFVSSTQMLGYDNLYASIQRIVAGGEDYYTEEPSPIL